MNLLHLSTVSLLLIGFSSTPVIFNNTNAAASTENIITIKNPSKEENKESIPWSFRRKLLWEDFQGQPQRFSDAVASTSTSLGLTYQLRNGELQYEVTCTFSKPKSWVLSKTPYILAHEQAHFDITEIFARKMNQKLQEYQFNSKTYRKDLNAIYQAVVDEKEAMQKAYDRETDHSRRKRIQYEWLERIEQILDETAPFSSYP